MAVPAFVGAGSGVLITGTVGTVSKTSCIGGNLIIVHVGILGTGQNPTYTAITNISNLAGAAASLTQSPNGDFQVGSAATGVQSVYYGRVTADGTVSVDVNITTNDMVARLYEFSGVSARPTALGILENTSGGPVAQNNGTSTTVAASTVITIGADRLALSFVCITANLATTNFTGESGGDWTEVTAEYSNTPATIQLQTAAMPAAGTLSGGTFTIGSSQGWAADDIALKPTDIGPVPPFEPIPFMVNTRL